MRRGPAAQFAGAWWVPASLALLMLAVQALPDAARLALRYERVAVLGGEWWRLLTGHVVHADLRHLGWNLVGVAIVWLLFARDYRPGQWLAIMGASTLAAGLGFLLLQPELEWYVGFSGVLHGCMAAGLVAWLARGGDGLTWIVAALFAAKLAWEHFAGPLPFSGGSLSVPVVLEAHTWGALGGLLAGLACQRGRPRRAAWL